jgi:hypothetical protein
MSPFRKKDRASQLGITPEELKRLKQIEEEEYQKTLAVAKQERLKKLEEEARERGKARAVTPPHPTGLLSTFNLGLKRTTANLNRAQCTLNTYSKMFPSADIFSLSIPASNEAKPNRPKGGDQ